LSMHVGMACQIEPFCRVLQREEIPGEAVHRRQNICDGSPNNVEAGSVHGPRSKNTQLMTSEPESRRNRRARTAQKPCCHHRKEHIHVNVVKRTDQRGVDI
jgi:hypothetical protein